MFPRPDRIILWKYADDAPVERLHKHYRTARAVVYVWITSSVLMASTLFEFMFSSKGIWRDIQMTVALAATAIVAISTVPAIVCVAWAGEIEKTLSQRGCPPPAERPIGLQVGIMAMKMCFWFGALILGVHLFR